MATVGEYKAEIKLTPLPATVSYRVEVDAYYFGSVENSVNTLKAFNHVYDWNLAATGVIEDHTLRITDNTVELDPVELLYWSGAANPTLTPLVTPAKVTLTQYDAVDGGQGVGSVLDTEVLYLPNPGSGQSHNFEITTSSARFSSPITKAGAGIEIQQDGNFAKLVATSTAPTASDGVRVVSNVIQLDIGGLTSLVPASPTLDSLVYWDEDLDSHKRVVIDQMPLTQFSNTGFTVNAEAVNVGTFPAGTWVFPSSSTIQVGSTTGDTPNIQFWDRDTSPGGYLDVISVPAALELDIGHSSWAVDILGSSVLVNGAAIGTVTSVTNASAGGITVTNETTTPTLAVNAGDLPNFTATNSMDATDRFVVHEAGVVSPSARQIAAIDIPLSIFNNNLGLGKNEAGAGITLSTTTVTDDTIALDYLGADSFIAVAPTGSIVASDEILFMDVNDTSDVKRDLVSSLPFTNNVGTVTAVTAGTGLDSSGGAAPNITLDLDELGVGGALIAGDHLVAVNGTATQKQLVSAIPLGIFSNNLGWTNNAGTVTQVDGTGTVSGLTLTGSVTSSGSLTLGGTLAVAEGDIVDDSILARVASNETISGTYTFSATPQLNGWLALQNETSANDPTAALAGYQTLYSYDNGSTFELRTIVSDSPNPDLVRNIPLITGSAANNQLLVSTGTDHEADWSGTGLVWDGVDTLTATKFSGDGSLLENVSTGALTLQTPDPTTGTYYPLLTPDSGGDAAVYVDSSDLRWNATDSQLLTADGANGSPSYSFISDPDTGMFLDAVGTLALATAGAVRLDVSSTAIEANGIPFRATASTSGHFGHSSFSACTHITTNLSYDGSGSPFTAANWRYISAAGASSTAGWVLGMAGNGGETGQSVELYSVPTSTGANATPASFTQRLKITTGQIQFGDGTQADPAYSFLSDDNTGFYRNASGSVRYSADNVSVLEMDGTGLNVLTGNLEMAGGVSIENGGNIWVGTQDGNVEPQIYFDESDAPADESRWRIVASGGDLFFQGREDPGDGFQNPTWMRFNRSGYTATSVTMGADLLPDTNNSWDLGSDALRWNNAYVEALDIKTSNASPILDGIRDDATIASGNTLLQVTGKGDLGSGPALGADILIQADETWVQGTDSGAQLSFRTTANNTWNTPVERMRIDHDGQVGIGTSDPLAFLHLSSAAGGNMLRIQDTGGTGQTANPYIDFYDSAGRIAFMGFGSTGNTALAIYNDIAGGPIHLQPSSGQVMIPNGTLTDPMLSFISDDDIGLYRVGSNHIGYVGDVHSFQTVGGTTDVSIRMYQTTNLRAELKYTETGDAFYIRTGGSGTMIDRLGFDWIDATHCRTFFTNTQVYNQEGTRITATGNQTLDWDAYNQVDITNVGARTIDIDSNSMIDGGHYCLIVDYTSGSTTDWDWTSLGGTLRWQNGQEPILSNATVGDQTVITFIKSNGGVLGFWATATV